MSEEKRRHKRVPYRAPFSARVIDGATAPQLADGVLQGFSTDISEGGMRLETSAPLPVDCHLEVEITVLGKAFRLAGFVVWSGLATPGLAYSGVQFPDAATSTEWPWKFQVARAFTHGNPVKET